MLGFSNSGELYRHGVKEIINLILNCVAIKEK